MPEARSPATQKAYGIAGTAGKSGRLPADEVHSVVRAHTTSPARLKRWVHRRRVGCMQPPPTPLSALNRLPREKGASIAWWQSQRTPLPKSLPK